MISAASCCSLLHPCYNWTFRSSFKEPSFAAHLNFLLLVSPYVVGGAQCSVAGSQSDAVQQEIDNVKAEIQATKQELAAAKQAEDGAKVDFLRNSLVALREEKNIILRAQAPGQHCLPCQN